MCLLECKIGVLVVDDDMILGGYKGNKLCEDLKVSVFFDNLF
jgi:hypothetical protein